MMSRRHFEPKHIEGDLYEVTNLEPGDWFWSDEFGEMRIEQKLGEVDGVARVLAKPLKQTLGVKFRYGDWAMGGGFTVDLVRLRPGYAALPTSPWNIDWRFLYPLDDYDLSALT